MASSSQQTDTVPEESTTLVKEPAPAEAVVIEGKWPEESVTLVKEPAPVEDVIIEGKWPEESVTLVKEPAPVEDVFIEGKWSAEAIREADWQLYQMHCLRLTYGHSSKAKKMPPMIYRMAFVPGIEATRRAFKLLEGKFVRPEGVIIKAKLIDDWTILLKEREKVLNLPRDYDTPDVMVEYSMCQTFKERKDWVAAAASIQQYRKLLDFAKGDFTKRERRKFHHLTDEEIRMMTGDLDQEEGVKYHLAMKTKNMSSTIYLYYE